MSGWVVGWRGMARETEPETPSLPPRLAPQPGGVLHQLPELGVGLALGRPPSAPRRVELSALLVQIVVDLGHVLAQPRGPAAVVAPRVGDVGELGGQALALGPRLPLGPLEEVVSARDVVAAGLQRAHRGAGGAEADAELTDGDEDGVADAAVEVGGGGAEARGVERRAADRTPDSGVALVSVTHVLHPAAGGVLAEHVRGAGHEPRGGRRQRAELGLGAAEVLLEGHQLGKGAADAVARWNGATSLVG